MPKTDNDNFHKIELFFSVYISILYILYRLYEKGLCKHHVSYTVVSNLRVGVILKCMTCLVIIDLSIDM